MDTESVTPNLTETSNNNLEREVSVSNFAASDFAFLICQHGAEKPIKQRWTGEGKPFKLAFSRPGLVTFKFSEGIGTTDRLREDLRKELADDVLVRHSGFGLGQLRGAHAETMVQEAFVKVGTAWDSIHVFERDAALPGHYSFEPGATELTQAIANCFKQACPQLSTAYPSPRGSKVLDVILASTEQWMLGGHIVDSMVASWPGGVFPVSRPPVMISRAYLKMAEAVAWSQLQMQPGDRVVEIGSSPGGASQRLLDLGFHVVGVDPAEMDPILLDHPRFEHWRSKSSAIQRKRYAQFQWLAADANVAPNYTFRCYRRHRDALDYTTKGFDSDHQTHELRPN